ncbi:hypothetical protein BC833DRAFT_585390 [Globomyces pollinis-pini]|nr:hypothetical protein BC833DRAFT_585390 [Globomyces pollinis-pini]
MSFLDELKAGKCAIYGQWAGMLSGLLLLIFGISALLSVPIFAIIAFCEGLFVILLEFTFLAKCIRNTDRIIAISGDIRIKCMIYGVFATSIWLSLIQKTDTILVTAVTLTVAFFFYGLAIIKGETGARSNVISQEGIVNAGVRATFSNNA